VQTLPVVLVAVAAIGAAMPARGGIFDDVGTGGPAGYRFDPPARSRAMGGASGAVFWGDLDGWSNPAVLGLAHGLRYEKETTDIPLGFEYEARRSVLGWGGLGIALAGRPFAGMGGLGLTGDLTIESSLGPPLILQVDEEVESWSVGASVSNLATTIAEVRGGRPPAFTRFADLALGIARKDVRGSSDPFVEPAIDWGLLVRTGADFTALASQCRIDLAYGYAMQNADGGGDRPHRHGTALRFAIDPPAFSNRRASLALQPLFSLGGAWDRVLVTSDGRRIGDEARLGVEISLANVAFIRFGEGPRGGVSTSGFGFALPIGHLARVRYDHARTEIGVLPDTTTDGWSVWLDPIAIADAWGRD